MRIAILFDLTSQPPEAQNYRDYEKDDTWDNEVDVKRALQRLGHEVELIGCFNDLPRLISDINTAKPDVIFNMLESFDSNRDFEPHVAGVLDLLRIPYTGTKPLGLNICKDKALSKKILSHHRIRIPDWVISKKNRPLKSLKRFRFPAFVKATRTEGSEGIAKDSLVDNEKDCLERAAFLHEKFNSDVLIEEFIDGRELYVSVLGNKRLRTFPIRELSFHNMDDDEPKFATYRTKWDEDYRKRWGIRNQFAKDLDPTVIKKAFQISKKAFEALFLNGYARFDFRLKGDSELVMLEANPNPSIVHYDDFAMSAKAGGMEYDKLIAKLIELATVNHAG